MPKKKKTQYFRKPHPTDSFRPEHDFRTVISSWVKGVVELHILKFPPAEDVTTFYIIGRLDSEEDYTSFEKTPSTEFIPIYTKYLDLVKKLDARYYTNGTIKEDQS